MLVAAKKTVRDPFRQDSAADAIVVTVADDGHPVAPDSGLVNGQSQVQSNRGQLPSTKREQVLITSGTLQADSETYLMRRRIRRPVIRGSSGRRRIPLWIRVLSTDRWHWPTSTSLWL